MDRKRQRFWLAVAQYLLGNVIVGYIVGAIAYKAGFQLWESIFMGILILNGLHALNALRDYKEKQGE